MITKVCLFRGWQSLAVLLHFLGGLDHLAFYTFWSRRGRAGASGKLAGEPGFQWMNGKGEGVRLKMNSGNKGRSLRMEQQVLVKHTI